MSKLNFRKKIPRLLISLLGVAFILWGISNLILGIIGKKGTAVITNIRREGGERNEAIRGQYTYIVSYTFKLRNGKRVDGYTRKIGNSVFIKADGKSILTVRYFERIPIINLPEHDTKPGPSQFILIAIGIFLIILMNLRQKRQINPGT
jgi:hypothetical protein